ncbi:MAG: hypothetical protein HC817_09400 [Saprospiraceae bacterium]|nr:hypothetical protein [Saprospiraceae bacterium]
MTTPQEQLKELREIRSLMERSSRFIGLSGLSGVAAGVCALAGAAVVYTYLDAQPFQYDHHYAYYIKALSSTRWGLDYMKFFLFVGAFTALAAILSGIFFTTRRSRRKGQTIWDKTAQRLLANMAIPLVAGGLFCLAMMVHGYLAFVAPATLIFYGMALVIGSKYTLPDVFYLGLAEIALGLVAMFMLRFGLEFWVIGFGFLHIIYGLIMYFKYERNDVG